MSDRLQDLCRENGICREVLIEAMFEYTQANLDALQQVLSEARTKNEQRQQMANLKRAKSMMERFGRSG
jgi:phage I-like protein